MGDTQSTEANPGSQSQEDYVEAGHRNLYSPSSSYIHDIGLDNGDTWNSNHTSDSGRESDTHNSSGTIREQKSAVSQFSQENERSYLRYGNMNDLHVMHVETLQRRENFDKLKYSQKTCNVDNFETSMENGKNQDMNMKSVSNRINSQTLQMSGFSASVPDFSNEQTSRQSHLHQERNDEISKHNSHFQIQRSSVHVSTNQTTRSASPNPRLSSKRTFSPVSSQNNPLFVKKQIHSSHSELLGSQQVFRTNKPAAVSQVNGRHHGVRRQQENVSCNSQDEVSDQSSLVSSVSDSHHTNHTTHSYLVTPVADSQGEIPDRTVISSDHVTQFQEMQHTLQQLQYSSRLIVQAIDNEERESEEWSSVINKKAAGIDNRLKKLEEKAKEDESMLIQLSDLITTISNKFSDLERQVKTIYRQGGHEEHTLCEMSLPETETEEGREAKITSGHEIIKEQKTVTDHQANELVTSQEIVSDSKNFIDTSNLPHITKDRKGYKNRDTDKRNDNRRILRREKMSKVTKKRTSRHKHGEESADQRANSSDPDLIEKTIEQEAVASTSLHSPSAHTASPATHSTGPWMSSIRPRGRRPSSESTESHHDSRDDYRNLAVLATGHRVLPTIPQEIIPNPSDFWNAVRDREVEAARRITHHHILGETYLLLDTSASMEGQPFTDMIRAATNFINGICDNSSVTEEGLCVMEVGDVTRVLVHLTNDRERLLASLGQLKPGGMSPISGALLVLKGLLTRKNTNIVVISDGMMTPLHIKSGRDLPDIDDNELKLQMTLLGEYFKTVECRVYFVPVGTYDSSSIEIMVNKTGGKEVAPDKISRIYNFAKNRLMVSQLLKDFTESAPDLSMNTEQFEEFMRSTSNSLDIELDELKDVLDIFAKRESFDYKECDPNMPPIGTRVRRGPDWKFDVQDLGMPGTVVSHTDHGQIWIEWDHGDKNIYRYGAESCYDVVTTDDPRCLADGQNIAVGCVVRRGKDWKHGNDDDGGPGKTGVVYIVQNNGLVVNVRWSNGIMRKYKFGEVEVCDPNELLLQESMLPSGGEPKTPPDVFVEKDTPEIDPMVAEMNRKNALLSGQPLRKEDPHSVPPTRSDTVTEDSHSTLEKKKMSPQKSSPSIKTKPNKTELKDRTQTDGGAEKKDIPKPVIDVPRKGEGIWQYKDGYGGWKSYDKEHNDKLEKGYCHQPTGVSMLTIRKSSYRILFSKMKQVNSKTKEMIDIRRHLSPS